MPEQMIKIDVPDEYEFGGVGPITNMDSSGDIYRTILFKKKEPEFIEVREYLYRSISGQVRHSSAQRRLDYISSIESNLNFIRWIDQDWRKVEI